jgi:hypothetical protein
MKFRPWMSAAAVATMALGLFCFGPSPVAAGEQVTPAQVNDDWGSTRYKTFQYPGRNNAFFMYPNSYVTFDVVNGKYWSIDHPNAEYQIQPRNHIYNILMPFVAHPLTVNYERFQVTFYTPDMKVLGIFPNIRNRYTYSMPRDGNDYERLICRLECNGTENYDIKMRILDAVDPVMAEPQPNERYRF